MEKKRTANTLYYYANFLAIILIHNHITPWCTLPTHSWKLCRELVIRLHSSHWILTVGECLLCCNFRDLKMAYMRESKSLHTIISINVLKPLRLKSLTLHQSLKAMVQNPQTHILDFQMDLGNPTLGTFTRVA